MSGQAESRDRSGHLADGSFGIATATVEARESRAPSGLATTLSLAAVVAVAIAAFGYYLYLIDAFPTIYAYDAIIRYANPDDLTVDRLLPGSQIAVFVGRQLSSDATPMRSILAAISCGTLLAAWGFTRRVSTPVAAVVAIVLLSTNLMFAWLATVPYGEMLFMGCVLGALVLLDKPKTDLQYAAGTLCLIGACMTRYEAWFLAAILIAERLYAYWRGERDVRTIAFCALVAMPMALWLLFGTSYTRSGESSIHERLALDHWFEFTRTYGRTIREQAPDSIILLSPIGFGLAWLSGVRRAMHVRVLAFAVLTFVMIVLVEPYGGVNFRSTFVTVVFIHIYGAIGLVMLADFVLRKAGKGGTLAKAAAIGGPIALAALLAMYHLPPTTDFVERASKSPQFYAAELAGQWLRDQPREGATIYALTDDFLQRYAIAGMADTPVDQVIVDAGVKATAPSKRTYVVAVYRTEAGLAAEEKALLEALTSGRIDADPVTLGPARAWIIDP